MDKKQLSIICEKASERISLNQQLFGQCSPVLVYGTGTFAQDIQRLLRDKGFMVVGFIDHRHTDKSYLNGLPIYLPEQAANLRHSDQITVILGLHNYQANLSEIITNLNFAGIHKIATSIDLYDIFGRELGIRYWLVDREYYFSRLGFIEATLDLLSDAKSRSLVYSVMEFRLTGDVTKLPEPDLYGQYHPENLSDWNRPLRFVDCGAFSGDTLADFLRNGITLESVAAFEPDLENYSRLANYVVKNRPALPSASLYPCGVFSTSRQLSFATGQGMASNISANGTTVIQCVALDDAIPTFAPNYIKMDIEGAEYEALLGATGLISEYSPLIAASLYHRPEHLWQVPLLIETIAPDKYSYHIRSHALNDFDLVLYAIPKEPV